MPAWHPDSCVRLVGAGPRYTMVRKALLRNGYRCSSDVICDIVVEILPDSYLVHYIHLAGIIEKCRRLIKKYDGSLLCQRFGNHDLLPFTVAE